MSLNELILPTVFWACFAAVVYAYLGYPVVVYCLARVFGRCHRPAEPRDEDLPVLSLLIAAYNEEAVIEGRILNALAMDYPPDKLEIVVATDGCKDRTAEIVRHFAGRGVRLLEYSQRRGKAVALNASIPELHGDVVMFSDANTYTEPDAARQLVRWFQNPAVGSVCGRLVLTDPTKGSNADSLYWRYETFLKRQEGRLGALLGGNGGIYAIRRTQYVPLPGDTILDDMVIPLLGKLGRGGDIVYEPAAVANEETPATVGAEFHRRSRIGAGGFGSLRLLGGLLNPRRGWVFFTFVSHKLCRWCCPFFLVGMLAMNAALAPTSPFYAAVLVAQLAFYGTALVAAHLPGQSRVVRVLRLTTMFVSMNGALLVGFLRWLVRGQNALWKRTARLAEGNPLPPLPPSPAPVRVE